MVEYRKNFNNEYQTLVKRILMRIKERAAEEKKKKKQEEASKEEGGKQTEEEKKAEGEENKPAEP
jgi:hypothetical protein